MDDSAAFAPPGLTRRVEQTLAEILIERAAKTPDLEYGIFPDRVLSLGSLHDQAKALARGLVAMGLRPRDHVAILLPNCAEFMIAHFAVQMAGGVSILLNARYRSHELSFAVGFSDSKFLITATLFDDAVNYLATLRETYPELACAAPGERLRLSSASDLEQIISFDAKPGASPLSVKDVAARGGAVSDSDLAKNRAGQRPDETALMIFTSGTTSQPKACEISHQGLQRSWRIFTQTVSFKAGEKAWVPMPFFHSGGIGLMIGLMAAGGCMASAPQYDPNTVLDMVERHRIEHLYPGFHLLAAPVIDSPRFSAEKFPFVRSMPCIGPRGTVERLQAALPVGAPVLSIFGMSEAAGLVTLSACDDTLENRLAWTGKPIPNVEVRICDPRTGKDLPVGSTGEILFRGGGAFRGYYKNPEATKSTIRDDGFIRSGDLGVLDPEGRLAFVGRIKDMLKVGGENVAAAEVESYISAHPAVAEVQVLGKPDDLLGETPVAFVELKPKETVSADDLIEFCRGKIARYKIPTEVHFVTEWPMSATKIQKYKLKELIQRTTETR